MSGRAEGLKTLVKRSRLGVIAGRTAVERSRDVKRLLGRRDGPMGATHRRFDLEGSVKYVERVYRDYLEYGDMDEAALEGKAVLELGPGDNLGVALCFLAAGAKDVVSTDRFIPFRDSERELQVLRAVVEARSSERAARVESVVAGSTADFSNVPFEFLPDTPIENAVDVLGENRFDLIVSRAVLEHVHDLDTAFASMDRLLAPGGIMIHKVDLDDHQLFTGGGQNPLTFLTIGDRTYGWMGEESAGLPNRVRIGWYQKRIQELGYEASYRVTHTVGAQGELEPHPLVADWTPTESDRGTVDGVRDQMLPRFRELPSEELAIAGFMLVARKPASD